MTIENSEGETIYDGDLESFFGEAHGEEDSLYDATEEQEELYPEYLGKGYWLMWTQGGKAPGPEPLKECLFNLAKVFERKQNGDKLTSLDAHDMACHIADAVLSGGIRRAALISLFNLDDEDMLTCKFGSWWEENPQRGRANNSAVVMRHKIDEEEFFKLWKKN